MEQETVDPNNSQQEDTSVIPESDISEEEKRERRKNAILYGRDMLQNKDSYVKQPDSRSSSPNSNSRKAVQFAIPPELQNTPHVDINPIPQVNQLNLPDLDTLQGESHWDQIVELNEADARIKTQIQNLSLPPESDGYYNRLHFPNNHNETHNINVIPEDQRIKGIDVFSIHPGHGNKDNYESTGYFEGTKHTTIGCDFAVQKMENKCDFLIISFSYVQNEVAQIHTFSTPFSRENSITLDFCAILVDKCFANLSKKCNNIDVRDIGSISLVFLYRRLKISVGRVCDVGPTSTKILRSILEDIFNVVYMTIHLLEPSSMFTGWKDPDTLEEQMKKQITLDDPNLLDEGIINLEERKQTWGEWMMSWRQKSSSSRGIYIPESNIDDNQHY